MNTIYKIILITIIATLPISSSAGLFDWIQDEAIPTLTGERPLNIKPYVKVTHNNKYEIKLGINSAKLQIGNVKIQTTDLKKRLAQAGCVLATGGDVISCAPDILQRELLNIADKINTNSASNRPSDTNYGNTNQTIMWGNPAHTTGWGNPANANRAGAIQAFYTLPSGTGMLTCGCWGFNPPVIAFEPRCSSSRVVIGACGFMCPTGGQSYGYRCM